MMLRIFLFIALVLVVTLAPVWVFAVCICVYAFFYTPYELVILSILSDGFYGIGHPFILPYYTILTCFVLIFAEWIKPRISGYNQ